MLDIAGGIILAVLFFVCLPLIIVLGFYAAIIGGVVALVLGFFFGLQYLEDIGKLHYFFNTLIVVGLFSWCVASYKFLRAKVKGEEYCIGGKDKGAEPITYKLFFGLWGAIFFMAFLTYRGSTM